MLSGVRLGDKYGFHSAGTRLQIASYVNCRSQLSAVVGMKPCKATSAKHNKILGNLERKEGIRVPNGISIPNWNQ